MTIQISIILQGLQVILFRYCDLRCEFHLDAYVPSGPFANAVISNAVIRATIVFCNVMDYENIATV